MAERIVLIGRRGVATAAIHDVLARKYIVEVIVERAPDRWRLLKGRIRRNGLRTVIGQVLFQALMVPVLRRSSSMRRAKILEEMGGTKGLPKEAEEVASVNAPATIALVRERAPAIVVINGTRIMKPATLAAISVPVLNMHVGITPRYRGVHGAYWALVEQDPDHCGVTVHLVDEGIDTGGILEQGLVHPTAEDNFTTYPLLQLQTGLPLLSAAIDRVLKGDRTTRPGPDGDRRWYHPTLWQYVRYRFGRGVR